MSHDGFGTRSGVALNDAKPRTAVLPYPVRIGHSIQFLIGMRGDTRRRRPNPALMPDLPPIERLQPCLLDRLTDDAPYEREESRAQRVISHQRYRRGVLRDLEWLFNASGYLRVEGAEPFNLRDFPEAWRSVINFGTRQLAGMHLPDLMRLKEEVAEAVAIFEPRITARTLTVRASMDRNLVSFEIEGDLWANPLPEHLHLKTTLDLESGQSVLGDATNG